MKWILTLQLPSILKVCFKKYRFLTSCTVAISIVILTIWYKMTKSIMCHKMFGLICLSFLLYTFIKVLVSSEFNGCLNFHYLKSTLFFNLLFQCRNGCIADNNRLSRDSKQMGHHVCPQRNRWIFYHHMLWLHLRDPHINTPLKCKY